MKIRVTYAMDPDVEQKLIVLAERNRRSKSSFIEMLIMKEWEQVSPFLQPPKPAPVPNK
jgi:predicted transcriptional regulator